MVCKKCGNQLNDGENVCPNCGLRNDLASVLGTGYDYSAAMANRCPMKWYKFLIYFALFVGGASNIISGIMQLSGYMYKIQGIEPELLYNTFGQGLHALDVIYGVILIAIGIFCFIVRSKLASYSSSGPSLLITLLVINLALSVAYTLIVCGITGEAPDIAKLIIQIGLQVIYIVLNNIYFRKRESLFVN